MRRVVGVKGCHAGPGAGKGRRPLSLHIDAHQWCSRAVGVRIGLGRHYGTWYCSRAHAHPHSNARPSPGFPSGHDLFRLCDDAESCGLWLLEEGAVAALRNVEPLELPAGAAGGGVPCLLGEACLLADVLPGCR